jgi:hypothetical protein
MMRMKIKVEWTRVDPRPGDIWGDQWYASVGGWILEVKRCALPPPGPGGEDRSRWSASLYAPGSGVFGGNLIHINRETDLPSADHGKERAEQLLNDCVGPLFEQVLEKRLATPEWTSSNPRKEEAR